MPRTVTGVMSAVFGTAQSFQARHGFPRWAIHLSDAISWAAGLAALWYLNSAPAWLQTLLALATVNLVAWVITGVYFLIWRERVEHFHRVRTCLLELATESAAKQANPNGGTDRIAEVMYGIVHAESFIEEAFTPRFIQEYRTFKQHDSQQDRSKGVFTVTAEYAKRLAADMTYTDLNPEFDPPKSYEKFKDQGH